MQDIKIIFKPIYLNEAPLAFIIMTLITLIIIITTLILVQRELNKNREHHDK